MAAELIFPIEVNEGTDWSHTWDWTTTTSPTLLGVAVDLTGALAQMMVRQLPSSPGAPLISLSNQPGAGITLGGTAGTITFSIAPSVISGGIAAGLVRGQLYKYDCEIVLLTGKTWRVLEGSFTVSPSITH